MFTAVKIKEEPPLDITEDLAVVNAAAMDQQCTKRIRDADNIFTVEEIENYGDEMEFINSDLSNQTTYEPNEAIAAKLSNGELFLSEKQGRSRLWEVFARIVDGDGLEIPDYVCCRGCNRILKFTNKCSSNLGRHKCYTLKMSSESGSKAEVDEATRKVLIRLFTKWVIENRRPYNLVNDSGLQAILQEFLMIGVKSGANVDVRKALPSPTIISQNVTDLYEQSFQIVKKEIALIKENGYGLTTKIWTDDYSKKSYIALTMHYLINGAITIRFLGMIAIDSEKCTNENIFENVQKLLQDFDCDLSFKSIIVTDRGLMLMKAFQNSQRIVCISHLLNYILQKSLEEISEVADLINCCSKLVFYFKTSVPNAKLNASLINYCPSRWHTVFNMLNSIEKNWKDIQSTLKSKNELCRIDSINLRYLKAVTKTLEPFEEAINALESETNATLHLVLLYHHQLKKMCKSSSSDLDVIQRLKDQLLFYLDATIKNNITIFHKLALFLYPPTNKLLQCSNDEKKSIEDECVRLLKFIQNETPSLQQEVLPASASYSPVSKHAKLFLDFVEPKNISDFNKINQELQFYKNSRVQHTADFNVFSWWQVQKNEFPLLYKLSCIILATPASSASSERIFSSAGNLLSDTRSEVASQDTIVNQIMFIHSNVGEDKLGKI